MPMHRLMGELDRATLLKIATTASVVTASLLIAAKLAAWLLSGSVAILASLVDSLMDAAASLINLFAVRYALKPADEEHRFGHGKAEPIAGLAQATFIAGSAVFLVLEAVDRLLHPQPLQALGAGMAVMLVAIAATLVLLAIQRYVIRRTGSTAIKADSLHYATDLLTNTAVLIALFLATQGWPGLDPVFALAIAVYILYSAWHIADEALHLLLDREAPDDQREAIHAAALADDRVIGLHDLRTRSSGHTLFVQLHLELDGRLDLTTAHALADAAEERILAVEPDAQVLIHMDPVEPGERSSGQGRKPANERE
jgi:ferrous-iron efflux pump FieF